MRPPATTEPCKWAGVNRVLKNDKKAIFKAATEASKAHQFILKGADDVTQPESLEEAA